MVDPCLIRPHASVLPAIYRRYTGSQQANFAGHRDLRGCPGLAWAHGREPRANPAPWLAQCLPGLFVVSGAHRERHLKSPFTSWIGGDGQEYMSFLTSTAFLILFYLLVNTASDSKTQRRLFNTLIISSAILAIFLVLQALGLRPLGFVGITSSIFNPVGGSVAAAVYLTAITLLASGLWLIGKRGDSESLNNKRAAMTLKVTTIVLSLFSLVYLIAQDYWVLWVLMLVGIVALFTFSTLRAAEVGETGKFILPMGLFGDQSASALLKSPLRLNIAPEVTPGTSASWSVATQSLGGSAALLEPVPAHTPSTTAASATAPRSTTQVFGPPALIAAVRIF